MSSIDPIDPIGAVDPPSVIDGPWWNSTIEPVGGVSGVEATAQVTQLDRDPRAEALGIAQHATAYIPTPVMPSWDDLRRRRRRP